MTEETQALVAEWGEAVYLAREDYTVDPHQHIERLVQRGDYLADARDEIDFTIGQFFTEQRRADGD